MNSPSDRTSPPVASADDAASFGRALSSECAPSLEKTPPAPTLELAATLFTLEQLRAAVPDMARRLHGFDDEDALLTGVESRFSSPVRIVRGEDRQSVSLKNLYPCGEGSGYSGGITSSAADGIKTAEFIYNLHKNSLNAH